MTEWFGKKKSLVHLESHPGWRARTLAIEEYDFLSGHILWPAQKNRLSAGWKTVAFFRRPDAQLASHIAWVRRLAEPDEETRLNRQPPQIRRIVEQLALRNLADPDHLMSLVTWLNAQKAFLFHNTQTQYISGSASPNPAALRTALNNMARISYVGITERLDEAMCMLADQLGKPLRTNRAPMENTHSQNFGLDISNPATRSALDPLIHYDWLLYDRARELFISRLHEWLAKLELKSPPAYSTVELRSVASQLTGPRQRTLHDHP